VGSAFQYFRKAGSGSSSAPRAVIWCNLNRYQSAYRPGHSTESALLEVVGNIEWAAGEGKCTVLLALDISAAFDAVDHFMLCRRAECDFGIRGTALRWLQSFVSDRSQYIALVWSDPQPLLCRPVLHRVPSLGHCYLRYVSPIDDVVRAHQMQYHQYADDLMLYTALVPSTFSDLTSIAGCNDAVSRLFMENALLLNPGKTDRGGDLWNATTFGGFGHHGWRQRCREHCAVQRCTQAAWYHA